MRYVLSLGATLLCAAASPVIAGDGVWTGTGPDGGSVTELLADPATPSTLYAGSTGGVFKSIDSGTTWTRAQSGLGSFISYGTSQRLAMDPSDPATLYALNPFDALFVSHDGAATWLPTGYAVPSNDAASAFAKATDGSIYLATYFDGMLVSHDGGATFTPSGTGLPTPATTTIRAIAPSPIHAGVVLAETDDGLYRSTDSGAHWSLTQAVSGWCQGCRFAFGSGDRVYFPASTLYRSDDGGASWAATATSAAGAIVAHPTLADALCFVDGIGHVRCSANGGDSSNDVSVGAIMANGTDDAQVVALAMVPTATEIQYLYAGTAQSGFFRGSSPTAWVAGNNGLRANLIRSLAPHPHANGRVLAGIADAQAPSTGVFLTTDATASWAASNIGLRAQDIRSLTYDPTTTASVGSTVVYATGRGSIDPTAYPVNSGLYKSLDGGASWTNLGSGLPTPPGWPAPFIGLVRNLALDPRSCASPPSGTAPCTSGPLRTLYATASGYTDTTTRTFRVIKSTDAGTTWSSTDSLPVDIDHNLATQQSLTVVPIAIDPLHPQTLYVGTSPSYDVTQLTTPTIASGVFRSDDGGATWIQRSNGLPFYPGSATTHLDILSLAIHPTHPDVLWASAYNLNALPHTDSAHIYKSIDGGASWVDSSTGISAGDIRQLLVDPADPNTIYAAAGGYFSNPTGVYKSSDGGATWHSISVGMENGGPTSVAIDPFDPATLYAGASNGVSVLHQLADSDHDGVPDIVEMAGPNGGDANHDGVPDYQQADVVSTGVGASLAGWTPLGADRAAAPADASSYVTISVAPSTAGTCDQTVDAQTVDPASVPADAIAGMPFQYPQALVRFELLRCPAATVTLHYAGAAFASGWSMRYFGPSTPGDDSTVGWHDLGAIAHRVDAQTWQLQLTAGSFGSYRPASSGSILFEGGPAYSERIFANGFD